MEWFSSRAEAGEAGHDQVMAAPSLFPYTFWRMLMPRQAPPCQVLFPMGRGSPRLCMGLSTARHASAAAGAIFLAVRWHHAGMCS